MIRTFVFPVCVLAAALSAAVAWPQFPPEFSVAPVIVDPADKQNVKVKISLALAWGEQFSPPKKYLRGFINLKEAMIRYTNIDTEIVMNLKLGEPQLLRVPFVVVTVDNGFELTPGEKANVKKYLENGGFLFLDNASPLTELSPAETSLKQMIRDVLGSGARFKPIPNDHSLYHCFFDFDGPPQGSENRMVTTVTTQQVGTAAQNTFMAKQALYLEGIWIDNRLVAVYANRGYIINWTQMTDNIPQLRMGVNMVVFSLVQPGGIASHHEP